MAIINQKNGVLNEKRCKRFIFLIIYSNNINNKNILNIFLLLILFKRKLKNELYRNNNDY